MSALRQRLKRPESYLLILVVVLILATADSFRRPDQQVTAMFYIGAVHAYQTYGRSLSEQVIACRYRPTCSEYSVQAVERYGIRHGVILSVRRLLSCTGSVPFGTSDPVP